MANLKTKVKKYLEANSKTWEAERNNIVLQNDSDGNGDYIHTWNVSGLDEPTAEQLETYESSANDEQALNVILSNRKQEYPSIADQLDMQYHDKKDDTTTWEDAITKVKTDNPK